MLKSAITALTLIALAACPVLAQDTGAQLRYSAPTTGSLGPTYRTGTNAPMLPRASSAGMAPVFGTAGGLPPTTLDSFVQQAGGQAFYIYGDEGTDGPPPLNGFEPQNRINAGIQADSAGLTTGHGSLLPSAWGKDEFIGGPEMSMSGSGGGGVYGALPGGTPGGGYYDPSGGVFPGADGGGFPGGFPGGFQGGGPVGGGVFQGGAGPGGFGGTFSGPGGTFSGGMGPGGPSFSGAGGFPGGPSFSGGAGPNGGFGQVRIPGAGSIGGSFPGF